MIYIQLAYLTLQIPKLKNSISKGTKKDNSNLNMSKIRALCKLKYNQFDLRNIIVWYFIKMLRGLHGVYNLIEVISSLTEQKLRSILKCISAANDNPLIIKNKLLIKIIIILKII